MIFRKLVKGIAFCFIFVSLLFSFSFAQSFVKMNDQQWIELSLDMVRKGIQQQDTTKVFMVFAPKVSVKGKSTEVKGNLTSKLQAIFDNSSKRKVSIEKPPFPRADNPLHFSNFWDFDILDPQIKIEGDSAIVDCELVLWGAPLDKGSDQAVGDPARGGSKKTKERFIFKSPPKIEQILPSGDWGKWPTPASGVNRMVRLSGKMQNSSIRSWQLVGFENLLDFLNTEIEQTQRTRGEDSYMKKK
jgi:hypothetical protein